MSRSGVIVGRVYRVRRVSHLLGGPRTPPLNSRDVTWKGATATLTCCSTEDRNSRRGRNGGGRSRCLAQKWSQRERSRESSLDSWVGHERRCPEMSRVGEDTSTDDLQLLAWPSLRNAQRSTTCPPLLGIATALSTIDSCMGWIDDMKLLTALEVGGNVTQTLVQAQNAGSKERKPH